MKKNPWSSFRIEGIWDFSLIDILSKISTLLADNGISIFAISTYNTDYILTQNSDSAKALEILVTAGYAIKKQQSRLVKVSDDRLNSASSFLEIKEESMIRSIGQVMLYVNDIEASAAFWRDQAGFEYVEKQVQGEQTSYLVAPIWDSDVQFVLHDKEEVAQANPEMNLEAPSILMVTDNIEATYQQFIDRGIAANAIMDLGFMRVFNFPDNEGNYFAVREG